MRNCIDCNTDISYKTSNNAKICERCSRGREAKISSTKISKRGYSIGMVKHKLITLYSGCCAICNWRATEELLTIRGNTFYSYGCEIHHIEPVSSGGGESLSNLILLCPNHHKQADLGIVSKGQLKAYRIPEEGVVDTLTLIIKGAELIDTII